MVTYCYAANCRSLEHKTTIGLLQRDFVVQSLRQGSVGSPAFWCGWGPGSEVHWLNWLAHRVKNSIPHMPHVGHFSLWHVVQVGLVSSLTC